MGDNVIRLTEELVQPVLEEMNLELVDVEFKKEGKNWFLRVFVDKENGVDIEECGYVSEQLSEKLDDVDPIEFPYFLEVASPGAERPLKNKEAFEKNVGRRVHVKLYEPMSGEKEFEGDLTSFDNEVATIAYKIKTKTKTVEIPYDKIAKARLAVSFN
ncbi:ribosome maturation factor RimP [Thalassobacillus devorans]|uniref:Ribosome maturation factor RimP n=1 Tax=Thalassobacillus devorans TaxID=279813 RepID=A0ABQ1P2Z1_9BACI|nr:ribosome maturation factor RimP [Thalassobacillus devorans]NIK27947.1 ribosome maturation factor RimP [Thalassobacillus devorans]GGC90117.1 ribosome maturation factor RimP [Thalassobacillus devorans]